MQDIRKKYEHLRIKDKYKDQNKSGVSLTKAALKAEEAEKGKGSNLLKTYLKKITDEQIKAILKKERCLVGINIYCYAIVPESLKKG